MKKISYTRKKSLPINLSTLHVKDLELYLKLIEEMIERAQVNEFGACLSEGSSINITAPLKQLSRVFGIEFSVSVELVKIRKVIKEIDAEIQALIKMEDGFFSRLKDHYRATDAGKKAKLELLRPYGSAW